MLCKMVMLDADDAVVTGTPTVTADGSPLTPTGTSALWQVDAPLGSLVVWTLTGARTERVQMPSIDPTALPTDADVQAAAQAAIVAEPATLTAAYDHAKDDVLTPLAEVAEAPVALAADQPFYTPTTWRDLEGLATATALADVGGVVDGIAADYAKTGEAVAVIAGIPASVDIRLSETHGFGSWESNQPTTGALVTQLSVGDDGLPLGQIMPYGTISVYLGAELHYRLDKIGDADGNFVLTLPYGSTWTLVAENPPNYRSTTAVITIPPLP